MKKFVRFLLAGCIVFGMGSYSFAQTKVGIYQSSGGAKGIYSALSKEKGLKVELIKSMRLTSEELFNYDVVIIGSLKGTPKANLNLLRLYVNTGGGILLNHDAVGYRGWKEPLFPELCRGIRTTRVTTLVPLSATKSPLLKDMPKEYTHAYYDHIVLGRGPKGKVIVEDKEGTPAVIIGEIGQGRVVANGAVTGYCHDTGGNQGQGEKAPAGGELKLLLNAINWLGETKFTSLSKEELKKRKGNISQTLVSAVSLSADTSWFSDNMLRGSYLVRQPVDELNGKFFLFYNEWFVGRWMGDERMRINLRQFKWLGITDVIYCSDFGNSGIAHTTDLTKKYPGIRLTRSKYKTYDPLMSLVKMAHEEGMDVWTMVHSAGRLPDNMLAYDKKGKKYVYSSYGGIMDVLSPVYRSLLHSLLDEYANKYNKYGNFKGIYYDELFFNSVDFHGDDIPLFDKFCKERFGESLPADIDTKLSKKRNWVNPEDKWWRRYILFKNWVNTDFMKDLTDYCHKKGLKIIMELRPAAMLSYGWACGMDNGSLTHLGADYYFVASGDYCEPCFIYPNALVGGHVYNTWGYYNTLSLRGHQASMYFVFNQIWQLLAMGNNPKVLPQLQRFIQNQREWADSENLARVSILHNQNNLLMRFKEPRNQAIRETKILEKLSYHQDTDMMLIEAVEFYQNYPVLIASEYSVSGLSKERELKLKDYVKKGGTIISLNADWSVSRADLTEEKDITSEMTGVKYLTDNLSVDSIEVSEKENRIKLNTKTSLSNVKLISPEVKVLACFSGTKVPAITEYSIGKGKVIGVYFDLPKELARNNKEMEDFFASLVKKYSSPEITTKGDLKIVTTLKKNNWVAVSLYGENFPKNGLVKIDLKRLGVNKKGYRVLMLGKQMEIRRPGDFWGKKGFWSAEEIKQGIPVTIVVDNDESLPLPEKFNLSSFPEKDAKYMDTVTRSYWEGKGGKKRHYEHEILVIAPFDELTITGK